MGTCPLFNREWALEQLRKHERRERKGARLASTDEDYGRRLKGLFLVILRVLCDLCVETRFQYQEWADEFCAFLRLFAATILRPNMRGQHGGCPSGKRFDLSPEGQAPSCPLILRRKY